jgi:Bacterial Ig domain
VTDTVHTSGRWRRLVAFALFALCTFTALTIASTSQAAVESPPPPQVWSDKADYAPGETVTLSGANWAPGEAVHIRVNDDAGQTWSRDVDVTASAEGTFADQFNLPDWFVAVYSVTATGASSGTATWSFTDGNVTLHLATAQAMGVASITVSYDIYGRAGGGGIVDNTCSGAVQSSGTVTVLSGSSANVPGFGNNNLSVRLGAVTSTPAGKTIDLWAVGDKTAETTPQVNLGATPCISANPSAGTNGNVGDVYAHLKNVNTAPVCSDGTATTNEDTAVSIPLNCTDAEGNTLTYTVLSGPSNGTLSGTGASRTYTPNANYNGPDSFTFKANDGSLDSNVATVNITVNAVNDAPTCSNGSATTDEDTPKAITLSCADVDGDTLTYSVVSGPVHGSVSSGTGAARTYSPAANYNGSDSFTFKANDGSADSNVATFSLTINAVDDPPTVARDNASVTVDEGDTATNSGTYDDVDGDTVTVSASVGTVTTNPDGTWDWSFDTTDGPDESQTVTITASDGTAGDEATVTFSLTVNNVAPVVTAAANQSSDEGESHSFTLGSFTDPGADGPWTVDVDWGDGSAHETFPAASPGSLGTKSHTYADGPDDHTVTIKVTEAGSGTPPSGQATFSVHVYNVAPSVQFTTAPTSADEGDTKTYQYTYSDPGADAISFAAGHPSCGDDGSLVGSPSISSSGSFQCSFPEGPNTTNVAIRVTDDDGASSMDVETVNIVEVTIADVAPTASFSNNGPVDEGSPATVSFSDQFDPSAGDTAAGFHYVYSCDGSSLASATYAGSGTSASHDCTFGDDGSYVVKGRIIDRDDGGTTYETTVTVSNAAPTASNGSFTFDPIFGTATAGFDFSDAGWLDTHGPSLSFVTWSDVGNRFATVTEENAEPNATGHASDTRTFAPGCFNLTVTGTAKDDDGATSAPLAIYSNSSTAVYGRGFRPPIMDNERNIAKYGNVVPVKVVLTNTCTGATVTNVPLFITIAKGVGDEAIEDTNLIAESVSAADTGSQMRTADGMYIYNLSTKSLSANTNYTIRIRPNSTTTPYILQAVLYPKK